MLSRVALILVVAIGTACTTGLLGGGGDEHTSFLDIDSAGGSGPPLSSSSGSGADRPGGGTGGSSSEGSGNPSGSSGSGQSTGTGTGTGGSTADCTVFPSDNWWNTDISNAPLDPKSSAYIASIGLNTNLHPDFGTIYGIPYVKVDSSVSKTSVSFEYDDESDPGPYPIPENPPIEEGGDHHILMVHQDECVLYELFAADKNGSGWTAGSGAIWDLKINDTRPDGWTSADAAGLPIYPGLVRYDEVIEKGEINHALRFTADTTQRAYVFPATHYASSDTDSNLPPMGLRVRLKASFDESGYPKEVQVILRALKKYGMFLADNGSNWFVSGAPDSRWDDDALSSLADLQGSDFEAIKTGELTK